MAPEGNDHIVSGIWAQSLQIFPVQHKLSSFPETCPSLSRYLQHVELNANRMIVQVEAAESGNDA